MAFANTFFPLIANVYTSGSYIGNRIEELAANAALDFTGSGLVNIAVGNIQITGGNAGQVLSTDGAGNLSWANGGTGGGTVVVTQPQIEFTLSDASPNTSPGSNKVFSNSNISAFIDNTYAAVYVNGVLLPTSQYTISGTTLTITPWLNVNDVIVIGPYGAGVGGASTILPQIEFTLANASPNASPGSNKVFSNSNISSFLNNAYAAVYINGVLQPTSQYTISGTTLTIPSWLNTGDRVTIGPSNSGSGAGTGSVSNIGTITIDTNSLGFTLTGGPITSTGNITLTVPTANALANSVLGALGVANANIANIIAFANTVIANAGNAFTYLNGTGNWTLPPLTANGVNTQVQFNNNGLLAGSANFTYVDTPSPSLTVLGTMTANNVIERVVTPTLAPTPPGVTMSIDLNAGAYVQQTLSSNLTSGGTTITITPSSIPLAPNVGSFILHLSNCAGNPVSWNFANSTGATSGLRIRWAGGTAPTLTSTALTTDILGFYTLDSGNNWYGYVLGQNV
jgi:hypothetical protein